MYVPLFKSSTFILIPFSHLPIFSRLNSLTLSSRITSSKSSVLFGGCISNVRIFEVGFGTGLNALLTLLFSAENNIQVDYTSIEAFPIDSKIASQLNYSSLLSANQTGDYFKLLHEIGWGKKIKVINSFSLQKIRTTIQDFDFQANQFDVIFFDAFAPAKQPEMWELTILEKVIRGLKQNGIFITYCAQGQLKRNLKSLGLSVESLPGPPGKREMVRASK